MSLYLVFFTGNGSVRLVCCMFDSVCELFGETIRNVFESFHFINIIII